MTNKLIQVSVQSILEFFSDIDLITYGGSAFHSFIV